MAKAIPFNIQETQDFATIRDLAHRIWPLSYASFLTHAQIANMLAHIYDIEALKAESAQGHRFFLAHRDGIPVGYASSYREQDMAWLKKLYLLPEWRGRGMGAQLMQAALGCFSATTEQRLLVNPENRTARAFYESAGFTCIGEKPVMMGDHAFTDLIYAR